MKIRVLLLSMFLLFLSAKPVVELVFSLTQADACCKAKEDNHSATENQKQETACDDLCSPFQPCCPYLTFSSPQLILTIPKSFLLIEKSLPVYSTSFYTSYSADFWQPPKIV